MREGLGDMEGKERWGGEAKRGRMEEKETIQTCRGKRGETVMIINMKKG